MAQFTGAARQNAQQNLTVATRTSMNDFRTKFRDVVPNTFNPHLRLATNRLTVTFFSTADRNLVGTASPWLIRECSTQNEEGDENPINEHQICADYAAMISLTLPDLAVYFRRALERNGANVVDHNLQDIIERGFSNAETAESWEPNKILIAVCHLLFILYKNVSMENYGNFMTNRTRAMKALAGLTGNMIDEEDILLSLDAATMVRTRLGSDHELRKRVLEVGLYLRVNAPPPVNTLFTYFTDILAWNEMSAFVFICENLLLTRSPVIRDAALRAEMNKLKETFEVLNQDQYPQYFRILKSPSECSILSRNRFPILMAVAHMVRPGQNDPSRQFVAPQGVDTNLLTRLRLMHEQYMHTQGEIVQSQNLAYLTQFDDNAVFQEDRDQGINQAAAILAEGVQIPQPQHPN